MLKTTAFLEEASTALNKLVLEAQGPLAPTDVLQCLGQRDLIRPCSSLDPDGRKNKFELVKLLGETLDLGVAAACVNHLNMPLRLLATHASSSSLKEILSRFMEGSLIGTAALTEPGHGSDLLGNTKTTIAAVGDELTVTGVKDYILNVPGATHAIVIGRTGAQRDPLGYSLIVIPLDHPGVFVDRIKVSCITGVGLGRIRFEQCVVERELMLGRAGHGLSMINAVFSEERLFGVLCLLGATRRALKASYLHAKQRSFQRSTLVEQQFVRHSLAELYSRYRVLIEAVHYSVSNSAYTNKRDYMSDGIKAMAAELAYETADFAFQIRGGRSFLEGSVESQFLMDSLASSYFAGPTDLMYDRISFMLKL